MILIWLHFHHNQSPHNILLLLLDRLRNVFEKYTTYVAPFSGLIDILSHAKLGGPKGWKQTILKVNDLEPNWLVIWVKVGGLNESKCESL